MITNYRKNDCFTAEITDMSNTGAGICHLEGITVFVQGSVDGDVVEGKIIKLYSNYMIARIEKIVSPSPYRISSDACGVSGRCGGCAFRHVSYEHELEIKKRSVISAFRKEGIDADVKDTLFGSSADGWRNKVQIPVESGFRLGYYSRHSHSIVESAFCPAHDGRIGSIIEYCAKKLKESPIGELRHICIRSAEEGVLVCFVCFRENEKTNEFLKNLFADFDYVLGVLININDKDTNVIYGSDFRLIAGKEYIEDVMLGMRFRISIQSFYQVNKDAASIAYDKLYEISGVNPDDRILDLYCGTGTIGLYFAKRAESKRLMGVDITPSSIRDAAFNAKRNNIPNTTYICSDSSEISISDYSPDILIVDPPRKGLSDDTINKAIEARPNKIAYMSCNPATLARDCKKLIQSGYTLGSVYPVNMFPRCEHVETVVLITKKRKDSEI